MYTTTMIIVVSTRILYRVAVLGGGIGWSEVRDGEMEPRVLLQARGRLAVACIA